MTTGFRPDDHPHRRLDPLSGRHILVSPHRGQRPWLGATEEGTTPANVTYDPECHLCPGNERASGLRNPPYSGAFVFDNDFGAINPTTPEPPQGGDRLFVETAVRGVARVLCFSPDHRATLPLLSASAMRDVIETWCGQTAELGATYPWVQVFENKGAMMGCSNPHPHGQVWATSVLPDEPSLEDERQRAWFARTGRSLLLEVVDREASGERVVVINPDWLAIVPFWAQWPFETLLLPRFPVARLPDLTGRQRDSLATIVQQLTTRYDNLFGTSFPYSMGWHGAPFDDRPTDGWQLHAHFYPPLLRSATIRKFMVGYEMLAEAQRDLTPERAAERLRSVSDIHYLVRTA